MSDDEFERDLADRLRRYESQLPSAPLPRNPEGRELPGVGAILSALATVAVLVGVLLAVRPQFDGASATPPATTNSSRVPSGPSVTPMPSVAPGPSAPPAPPGDIPDMVAFDGSPGTPVGWCWKGECAEIPIDFDHTERYEPVTSRLRTSATVTHVAAEALASDDERVLLEVTRDRSEVSIGPLIARDTRMILVTATFPSGDTATYAWRAVRGVVVGVSADRQAILAPLVEARPELVKSAAELAFKFEGWDRLLGVEGAVLFLKASDATGHVVLDRMVDGDGDLEPIPPGDYTVTAYYRTCDGDCTVLDEAREFCSMEASLQPNGRYRLTVIGGPQPCHLT